MLSTTESAPRPPLNHADASQLKPQPRPPAPSRSSAPPAPCQSHLPAPLPHHRPARHDRRRPVLSLSYSLFLPISPSCFFGRRRRWASSTVNKHLHLIP